MADEGFPKLYYRVRDSGAAVFRVDAENRQRRIELDQVAMINLNRDEIKPVADVDLSKAEMKEIRAWMNQRKTLLALRDIDDMHRTLDYLNATAHWAQSRATDAQLDEVTEDLLLAMHDLRSVLVRRKAERVAREN